MSEKRFDELWDYREAEDLAKEIYRITSLFPSTEKYLLVAQLRSAAVSVFSNIAEGCGRGTDKDYSRFLIQARGSVEEILAQLRFSRSVGYVSDKDYEMLYRRYNRLAAGINNHINFLRNNENS